MRVSLAATFFAIRDRVFSLSLAAAAGDPTRALVFGRSDRGRPHVVGVPACRLDLNVSHHGAVVVLAAVAPEFESENPPSGEIKVTG